MGGMTKHGRKGGRRSKLGGVAAASLALASLVALPAHAHLGHEVARAERYLKLDVAGRSARLVVSLTLGAREGARLLAAADTDGSGAVSEAERDAYLAEWGAGLERELPVTVDGKRIELSWGEPYMDPIGPVRPLPVTVELVARFELDGGRQTIRLEDRVVRREIYDRTDVAFRTRDDATLIASGLGEEPLNSSSPDVFFGREQKPPVVLTAIVETPERPVSPMVPFVLAAVIAVLGGGVLLGLRLRRRSR